MNNAELNAKEQTESYTNLSGELVTVECLEWLEDGSYSEQPDSYDFDEDGDEFYNYSCSRYQVGVDANGEGISVWLNDDMQEVEV